MEGNKITRKEKPNFVRQDTNKTKRLKKNWRRPRGFHSKIRLNKKGHAKSPSQGYRNPKEIRGKELNLVYNLKDLENLKEITIASVVGLRKKIEILKKSKESQIKVLNVKDVDGFIKKVEKKLLEKASAKKQKEAKKKKSKAELEKKEVAEKEKSEEDEKKEVSKKLTKDVKQKPVEIVENAPKTKANVHRATAPKQK